MPVSPKVPRRSDADWIAALRGRGHDNVAAVRDLETYLRRMLARAVRGSFGDGDLDELVQESLARICESLASFRGDGSFTTWAAAVANRVAFTELRRRRARDHRGAFDAVRREVEDLECPRTPPPHAVVSRAHLLAALEHAIATRLTERQRVAVLAELRGVPTVEVAERLGTNQNALYKLTHDARKKLRSALLAGGFTSESVLEPPGEELR